jgi:hypothetical protein
LILTRIKLIINKEPAKNYINSNTFKIKQIMRKVKEKEAQKEAKNSNLLNESSLFGPVATPVKALWKSDKYKDVQSKLKESLQAYNY